MHCDMKEIKVEGHPDLIRDTKSQAIVNTNRLDYEQYMKTSRHKLMEKNRVDNIEKDLSNLKNEISEIKDLLVYLKNKL